MESTSRPYRYRSRPTQRALDDARREAHGARAIAAEMETLAVRERLPGWHMGRLLRAASAMGVA